MQDFAAMLFIVFVYSTVPYAAMAGIAALAIVDLVRGAARSFAFHAAAMTSGRKDMYTDWHQEESGREE